MPASLLPNLLPQAYSPQMYPPIAENELLRWAIQRKGVTPQASFPQGWTLPPPYSPAPMVPASVPADFSSAIPRDYISPTEAAQPSLLPTQPQRSAVDIPPQPTGWHPVIQPSPVQNLREQIERGAQSYNEQRWPSQYAPQQEPRVSPWPIIGQKASDIASYVTNPYGAPMVEAQPPANAPPEPVPTSFWRPPLDTEMGIPPTVPSMMPMAQPNTIPPPLFGQEGVGYTNGIPATAPNLMPTAQPVKAGRPPSLTVPQMVQPLSQPSVVSNASVQAPTMAQPTATPSLLPTSRPFGTMSPAGSAGMGFRGEATPPITDLGPTLGYAGGNLAAAGDAAMKRAREQADWTRQEVLKPGRAYRQYSRETASPDELQGIADQMTMGPSLSQALSDVNLDRTLAGLPMLTQADLAMTHGPGGTYGQTAGAAYQPTGMNLMPSTGLTQDQWTRLLIAKNQDISAGGSRDVGAEPFPLGAWAGAGAGRYEPERQNITAQNARIAEAGGSEKFAAHMNRELPQERQDLLTAKRRGITPAQLTMERQLAEGGPLTPTMALWAGQPGLAGTLDYNAMLGNAYGSQQPNPAIEAANALAALIQGIPGLQNSPKTQRIAEGLIEELVPGQSQTFLPTSPFTPNRAMSPGGPAPEPRTVRPEDVSAQDVNRIRRDAEDRLATLPTDSDKTLHDAVREIVIAEGGNEKEATLMANKIAPPGSPWATHAWHELWKRLGKGPMENARYLPDENPWIEYFRKHGYGGEGVAVPPLIGPSEKAKRIAGGG